MRNPAPFPGTVWGEPDPRIADAEEQIRIILETEPVLSTIHPWSATELDEDIMLHEHAFMSGAPESAANIPSYGRYIETADHTASHAYLKRVLQFLTRQKRQAGITGDRWILKTPDPMRCVETRFGTFPGATLIQTPWLANNRREDRPPHEYSLETFGFSQEGIAEHFREYRERFVLGRD